MYLLFSSGYLLQHIFLVSAFMPVPKKTPKATHLLPLRKGNVYFIALLIYMFIHMFLICSSPVKKRQNIPKGDVSDSDYDVFL